MSDYNFKVKCIDVGINFGAYDCGGIYKVKNGALTINGGGSLKGTNQKLGFRNIDELNSWSGSKFEEVFDEEIKEDKKMNKFKVGDRVRILDGTTQTRWRRDGGMKKYINTKGIIASIDRGNPKFEVKLDLDNGCWWFNEEDLKLVEDKSTSKTFTITTSNTITTLTDGTHTTSINRYYTDKHDDMIALEEVVKKYKSEMEEIERRSKEPKVGDMVKIVDNDKTYTTYYQWFFENKITDECAMKWRYNFYPKNSERVFRVVEIGKHNRYDVVIALITDDYNTYLINIEGLEVIK